MDDKGANIDLLFRNGLKSFEVLPPREVWSNIAPVIRKKQQPLLILRTAAMVVILLSMTFLIYNWGKKYDIKPDTYQSTANPGPAGDVIPGSKATAVKRETGGKYNTVKTAVREQDVPVRQSIPEDLTTHKDIRYQLLSGRSIPEYTKPEGSNNQFFDVDNPKNQVPGEISPDFIPVKPGGDRNKRWTIAALVSPTYYTAFSSGNNIAASQLMAEEQHLLSYAGGIALSYRINKRVSVQSGLYYSSFGNELAGISTFGGFRQYDYTKGDHNFEIRTASGTVYTNNADVFLIDNISKNRITTSISSDVFDPSKANLKYLDNSLRQNFSYLELPVVLKYKIIDKAVDFNIIGGLSSNILVANSVYTNSDGEKLLVGKTGGLNLITFSSSLGMGMEYNFTDNLSLNLEPTFRYYLNPFSNITGMKIHPYSFGIFSGLSFKF